MHNSTKATVTHKIIIWIFTHESSYCFSAS